jgi:UDP-N-acetylmuramyl pentapeptide synthase
MHRKFGLQAGGGSFKVGVLDTIHGASAIADRMVQSGIEAQALEVYHHSPSIAGFNLIVAPVHLWPGNTVLLSARKMGKRIITHHQAVGELLRPSIPVFEVTGTHSKTSTALLLAGILSFNKKVVSHTTRGIELWQDGSSGLLEVGLSIAPGNVIYALDAAAAEEASSLVCEVSLGGTGLADCGILTSFSGDYRIARGTKWASTAKLQMISLAKKGSCLAANTDAKIAPDLSFGEKGMVRAEQKWLFLGKDCFPLDMGEDLDFPSYQTALSASAAAAYSRGLTGEEIAIALEGFDGFPGRMKILHQDGLTIMDSSGSGLKLRDVERALDISSGRLALVVGEESQTVCEGMDVAGLVELLRDRREEIQLLILVGERLSPWAEELRAGYAPDLFSGRQMAEGAEVDRLLLCVKCFR